MRILYKNSKNEIVELTQQPYLMLAETGLFNYRYAYETEAVNGHRTYFLDTEPRLVKIAIFGSTEQEYNENIQKLMEVFDYDMRTDMDGRLYFDDFYLNCRITASTKPAKYLLKNLSVVEFEVSSENFNWLTENILNFDKIEVTGGGYDYPYDYQYDFKQTVGGSVFTYDGYIPSDYRLTIYGRCVNPVISIGDWNYGVENVELSEDEQLTIDSKNGTIIKTNSNGTIDNLFSKRLQDFNFRKKIDIGENIVAWNGQFAFDLLLYEDRSEPKWTSGYSPIPSIDGLDANVLIEMIIGEMENGGN